MGIYEVTIEQKYKIYADNEYDAQRQAVRTMIKDLQVSNVDVEVVSEDIPFSRNHLRKQEKRPVK